MSHVRQKFLSLSQARKKVFADLKTRTGRSRRGKFLLEGPRAIEDALQREVTFEALIVADGERDLVESWAERDLLPASTDLYSSTSDELSEIADTTTPQGLVAVGSLPRVDLPNLPADTGGLILVIDAVQNPGNLGTLMRTFGAVGGRAAICLSGAVDPYNPKALRGSAGATFEIEIATDVEPERAVEWCRANDYELLALVAGAESLFAMPAPTGGVALVIGNETAGISPEVAKSSRGVGLPMSPGVESLSAATAGSIAMFALAHDLRPARGTR